ncbi:MAG: site-specific integrase [Candidatus Woesearchaeota archaeon]
MSDRIDIHNMDRVYADCKRKIERDSSLHPRNREIILQYLRDSELGKTIKKGQKRKIGSARNVRVAGLLKQMDNCWFKKPLDQITTREMEDFILRLENGIIVSNKGKPYSSESQMTMKKLIRKFWKWMKGESKTYPEEVDWIDTSGKEAEICGLPNLREDVEKMVSLAPNYLKKAMIMVLFDSGAREGEFLNLRLKDVEKLSKDDDTLVIRIRHSKTFGRPVSLPIATPHLRQWLEIHPDGQNKDAPLWVTTSWKQNQNGKELKIKPMGKAFFFNNIRRVAEQALGIKMTPQMMRHTSATYYAPKLDRATYCRRFGWSFASRMPDRYIDWAKVMEKKTVEIVRSDDFGEVRKENLHLKEELARQREEMQGMKDSLRDEIVRELLAAMKES